MGRILYGNERSERIDKYARWGYLDPVKYFNGHDDPELLAFQKFGIGMFWPVVGVLYAGLWVVDTVVGGSKKMSQYEIKQEKTARERRIAQLEKELDSVRDTDPHDLSSPDSLTEAFMRHNHRQRHIR